ncbi:MAG: uL15 family ribosomal protein [Nanoarchaeota archaeon]|nr:uL15 family ribosomal protein [Nanoarchaeota archaeon]
MVVKTRKKIIKLRGSRTCAGGHAKKRRGAGSRGGRGNAGLGKHKKSLMVKEMPKHYGRYGFKLPQKVNRLKEINAIKLRDIDILANKLGLEQVDLTKFGYDKVLSGGILTKPITVKAKLFSKKAKQMIVKYGGSIIEE